MNGISPPLFREGLFLRPHHLQLEQRHREGMAAAERALALPYAFGVFDVDIDQDKLRLPPGQRTLEFRRLCAVLPGSGRIVMFDANGDGNAGLDPLPLPDSLGAFGGRLQIWLAVPAWNPGRPNTADSSASLPADDMRTYYSAVENINDENTGANSQPVALRRIRAMLLFGNAGETPRGQFEFLPLVRLVDARDESRRGELMLDPEYAPPSLTLAAYPELARQWELFARHVAGQRQAAENRVRPRFNLEALTNAGWRRLFRLQIINAFAPKLLAMAVAPGVSLWDAWGELAAMHGQLAGLYPEYPWEEPEYDHMEPMRSLRRVMERIRAYLDAEAMPRCQVIDFRADPDGFLRCRLPEWPEDREDGREFYLSVRGEGDQDALRREVLDGKRFKIMAVRDLSRQIFGVPLRHEAIMPEDIPAGRDMVLFRLQRDEKCAGLWEGIIAEGEIGISAVSKQNAETAGGGGLLFSLVVISPAG